MLTSRTKYASSVLCRHTQEEMPEYLEHSFLFSYVGCLTVCTKSVLLFGNVLQSTLLVILC